MPKNRAKTLLRERVKEAFRYYGKIRELGIELQAITTAVDEKLLNQKVDSDKNREKVSVSENISLRQTRSSTRDVVFPSKQNCSNSRQTDAEGKSISRSSKVILAF